MDSNELIFSQWKANFICNNDIDSSKHPKLKLSQYLDEFSKYLSLNKSNDDLSFILNQLNSILDFILETFKTERDCYLISVNIMKKYSLIYSNVLNSMLVNGNQSFNISLIEITSKLNDLLISNLKKLSMKSNWYSSIKHFSVILFQSIFDKFDGFLNNYKSQILTSIYKHLSKLNDNLNSSLENELFKANYFNDFVILANIIISHDIKSIIDEKLFTRLMKMVKYLTSKNSSMKFCYPLISVTNSFTILSNLLKSDKFLSPLISKNSKFNSTNYLSSISNHLILILTSMDTENKQLRLSLSKNLSDLLVFTFLNFPSENNLEICLNFLLFDYRKENQSTLIKVGVIESLIQFLSTLNLYYKSNNESNFITLNFFKILNILLFHIFDFGEINLKLVKSKLKEHKFITLNNSSMATDSLKTLNHLSLIFKFIIGEIDNDLNKLIILSKLIFFEQSNFGNGVTVLPLDKLIHSNSNEIENIWYAISLIQLTNIIIDDLGEYILTNTQDDQDEDFATKISNKLLEFCSNKNFKIRILAVESLIKILKVKPQLILKVSNVKSNLLIESFNGLDNESKNGNFNENHGNSLLISSILSFSSKDFITNDLILNSFSLSLNFLKKFNTNLISNNLFSNDSSLISNIDYEKQLISWILLMGVFNFNKFNNESILLQDSTQFLTIWKNLLNLNFVNLKGGLSTIPEILKLIEVKNYSLVCLTTFISFLISNSKLSIDLIKNLNQILSLSFASITNLINQLHSQNIEINQTLELSININKLRIYQNYLKLLPYLNIKNEINSNMLIEIVKNFSDINKFQPTNIKNLKRKEQTNEIYKFDDQFGLTSKFNDFKIDELMFKLKSNQNGEPPKLLIESRENENLPIDIYSFDVELDNKNSNYFNYSNLNDSLLRLLNGDDSIGYTNSQITSPDYHTMIVDVSIEIFSFTFPYLSTKIQQSIIENIRSNVFYQIKESSSPSLNEEDVELKKKSIDLRRKSIGINCSVAIHSLLSFMINSKLKLKFDILNLLLETIKNIDLNDDHLRFLNSQSFGMCNSLFDEDQDGKLINDHLNNQISILYNSIIENPNPNSRSFDVLALGYLTKYTNIGNLKLIEDTIFTLLFDPHPMVHSSSMLSLDKLIINNLNFNMILKIINSIEMIMIDDTFGFDSSIIISNDLNFRAYLNSNLIMSKLIKDLINLSGPMINQWDENTKTKILNLMSTNLKLTSAQSFEVNLMENLKFLSSISIFDKSNLAIDEYVKLIENVIKDNLFIGVNVNQRFNSIDYLDDNFSLFPMSTSTKNLALSIDSVYQLIKITKIGEINLTKEFKELIWIIFEKFPLNESALEILKIFTIDELSNGSSINEKLSILDRLINYFFISKDQLDKPLYDEFKLRINNNWPTKVKVISQAPIKKKAPKETPKRKNDDDDDDEDDDESQQQDDQEQQNEPVALQDLFNKVLSLNEEQPNWRFKTYLIKLINLTLDECFRDNEMKLVVLKRLDEIIKISFISSTNNLNELRIESLKLLNKVIDLFSNVMDPIYNNKSILDQQNAQIISTIIPTFNKNSNLEIVSEGLLISSKLITKDGNFHNMKRLIKILTTSLENLAILNKLGKFESNELSSNDIEMIKIGNLEIFSNKSIDKVKVKILQSWSNIIILNNDQSENGELNELILKYIDILIPLLINTVREFIIMKYSSLNDTNLKLYDECKIDLIESISILIETHLDKFESLLGDDLGKIFITLFSEMFEYFIKMIGREVNKDDLKMLKSFSRILNIEFSIEILFNDSIYLELIDLLNKLILKNDGDSLIEINLIIREIFIKFFKRSTTNGELDSENVDKLFELIRLQLKIIIKKLPFIKTREILEGDRDSIELNGKDLIIIRKSFMSIIEMNDNFPIDIKRDILLNLLFMLMLIKEFGDFELISILLPIYQIVFNKLNLINDEDTNLVNLINIFKFDEPFGVNDQLICFIMMRSIPKLKLNTPKLDMLINMIINGLKSEDDKIFSISVKAVKSLIMEKTPVSLVILPELIPKIIDQFQELKEPRLVIELCMGLIKRDGADERKIQLIYQLIIKLILSFKVIYPQFIGYVREKLLELVEFDIEAFKFVLSELDLTQREEIESILKNDESNKDENDPNGGHIELKTFI